MVDQKISENEFPEDDGFDFTSFEEGADGSLAFGEYEDTTRKFPSPQARIMAAKFRAKREQRTDAIKNIINDFPKPGEVIHVISGGLYNFWDMIPTYIQLRGTIAELYAATWTSSFQTARDCEELLRKGQIKRASFIFGSYFKKIDPPAYTKFAECTVKYGGKIKILESHMKAIIMKNINGEVLVAEGSANFNKNPRVEQCTLTNDQGLYDFYRETFEEIFALEGKYYLWR